MQPFIVIKLMECVNSPDNRTETFCIDTTTQAIPIPFDDDTSVFDTELWDPATGLFTLLSPIAVGRNYHSVGLLLPDARVFSGGGGLCGTCTCGPILPEWPLPAWFYTKFYDVALLTSFASSQKGCLVLHSRIAVRLRTHLRLASCTRLGRTLTIP